MRPLVREISRLFADGELLFKRRSKMLGTLGMGFQGDGDVESTLGQQLVMRPLLNDVPHNREAVSNEEDRLPLEQRL
jgi:hypothetical protein